VKRAFLVMTALGGLVVAASAALRSAFRPVAAHGAPGEAIVVDGVRLHYVEEGEGAAIVLLHGFGASAFSWRLALPMLGANYRVVAVDLPGFGFSDRDPRLELGHEAQAWRVARLLDVLGIRRATVVGHSMGGGVAQRLAISDPRRVERLVLVAAVDASAAPAWGNRRGHHPAWGVARFATGFPGLVRWLARRGLQQVVADPATVTDEMVDGYAEPLLIRGTLACLEKMAADTAKEAPADLSRITAPTLVISGARDRIVPARVGEGLAAKIRGARHVVLGAAGHLPPEECPEALVEEVLAFLHEPGSA